MAVTSPKTNTIFFGLALMLLALLNQPVHAQKTDIKEAVNHLPAGGNMIMLVNVENIQATELAQSDQWIKSIRDHYASELGQILRNSKMAVVVANVSQQRTDPICAAALMVENDASQFAKLRTKYADNRDQHLGFEFLEMSNDSYVLSPRSGWVGIFSPAERQYFSKWLTQLKQQRNWLRDSHLRTSVDQFDPAKAEVVITADLRYAYSPLRILQDVGESQILSEFNIDPKVFADLVSSIEGYTIKATIDNDIQSRIVLKFSEEIEKLESVARDLAFDFLDDTGMELPEMIQWNVVTKDHTIQLSGPLTIKGFQMLVNQMDVIDDLPDWTRYDSETAKPGAITRDYFKSVNDMIDQFKARKIANVNFGVNAMWMDRYADRIRRLPTQYVDQEVVDYADAVVIALIESATLLRDSTEKSKTEIARIRSRRNLSGGGGDFAVRGVGSYYSGWNYGRRFYRIGGYGYGGTDKNQRRQAVQQNAETAYRTINARLEELNKYSLQLQRSLQEKYDLDY